MKKYSPSNIMTFLVLPFFLLACVFDAHAAHQLTIKPSLPNSANQITVLASGEWYSGGAPGLDQWIRTGQTITIFATGIIPGIPQDIVPYQFNVDIGRLPPGQYNVEYYIDVIAAPGPPPVIEAATPGPDATLSFEVLASQVLIFEPVTAPIPTLSAKALTLLVILLLLKPVLAPGGISKFNEPGR